jgi:hypothetical protein
LKAIGIHGNFTAQTAGCTSISTGQQDNAGFDHYSGCCNIYGMNDFVFFPNSTITTQSSGCSTGTMQLFNMAAALDQIIKTVCIP